MSLSVCSLLVSAALSAGTSAATPNPNAQTVPLPSLAAASQIAVEYPVSLTVAGGRPDVRATALSPQRPAALPALYASLAALQVADVYSTRRALNAGAREANPLLEPVAGNSGAMLAVKAASAAGAIFFTERAWKKNRKGAILLIAAINGVTAAVVANNLKNAK